MSAELTGEREFTNSRGREASTADLYDALSGELRWRCIKFLASSGGWVPIDELVHQMATSMKTEDAADARRRLRVQFHHIHLPKMADLGLIEIDDYRIRLLVEPLDERNCMERRRD